MFHDEVQFARQRTDRNEYLQLINKLQSIARLSYEDQQAVLDLPMVVRPVPVGTDLVHEGDRPNHCCLLIEGMACRYKLLGSGRRQIMSFHTPGDIVDLQSLHVPVLDHDIGVLMPSRIGTIAHRDVHALIRRSDTLMQAFWRDTLVDAAIFRQWIVGLGRRSAYGRIAHLFCEVATKLAMVGLAADRRLDWPITQTELGDALGLTNVHVNRVLQKMRADQLICLRQGSLEILDWEGLQEAAEFDPDYLGRRSLG